MCEGETPDEGGGQNEVEKTCIMEKRVTKQNNWELFPS
jgi:hypothetical protein